MKNIISLFILFYTGFVFGQGFQLAGIEYAYYPESQISDASNDQAISFQEYTAFLNVPLKLNKGKTILLAGILYSTNQSRIFNAPLFSATNNRKRIHKIAYSFTLAQKLGERWTWIFRLKPTMASDFKEKLNSNDFLFQGATLMSRKINEHLSLGAGIVYTTQLGEPRFLPSIQVKYKKNRHFVDILLPSKLKYLYQIDEKGKFNLGVKGAFDGGDYNISIEDFVDADPSTINNVIYTRVNFGGLLNIQLTEMVQLELFGGISLNRRYEFENFEDVSYNYNAENGPLFSLGFVYVPKQKKVENN